MLADQGDRRSSSKMVEVRINLNGQQHQKLLLRFRRGGFGLLPPPQFMNKRLSSGCGFGW